MDVYYIFQLASDNFYLLDSLATMCLTAALFHGQAKNAYSQNVCVALVLTGLCIARLVMLPILAQSWIEEIDRSKIEHINYLELVN